MSATPRTLLCVHAHPDDEAIFTAGATMLYAERGYRVVLITCTNGRLGIDQNNHGGNHPDHIQAHRITMEAIKSLDYEPTVYFNAIPKAVFRAWRERMREEREANGEAAEEEVDFGTADELIAAAIDVSATTPLKFDALVAHASQITEDSFWMKMGKERFTQTMNTEWFVRATNPNNLEGVVTDIFAGYR